MKKGNDNKERKKKEVRKSFVCEKCGSHYIYVLKDKTICCRRCGHRNEK